MINVKSLKKGNIIKILVDNKAMSLKSGDLLQVVKTGYSNWDNMAYCDCKTNKGDLIEIMKNWRDFELLC